MVCAAIRRLTPCRTFTVGSFWTAKIRVVGVGARSGEVAMKTSVLIILTLTVLMVGALAVMNNACKSAQHAWCAPMSAVPSHKPAAAAL